MPFFVKFPVVRAKKRKKIHKASEEHNVRKSEIRKVISIIKRLKIVANNQKLMYPIKMGKKEILIKRLKSKPTDFTFDEAETLLGYLNYVRKNKGKTSGSRVMFTSEKRATILMHNPHPGNELKAYQVQQLIDILTQEDLI